MNLASILAHPVLACAVLLTFSNLFMTFACLIGAVYFAFRG
jgi:uncharacterized protein (DUF486 family)